MNFSCIAPMAGAVVLCALSAPSARAQITYTPIIVPGQPAPGSATGTFSSSQAPTCQQVGRAALFSGLTNTPNPGADNLGIWQGAPGATTLIAIANQPITGSGGLKLTGVNGNPTQNRAGAVIFTGRLDSVGGFATDAVLCYSAGAGAQIAAREGDAAPGVPGGLFGEIALGSLSEFAFNNSGRVAFLTPLTGVPASGNRALFAGDAATQAYELVARNGEPAPTPGGAPFSFIYVPAINAQGVVAFYAILSASPFTGLFSHAPGGPLETVIASGDPAPGLTPGWVIGTLFNSGTSSPQMNDAGQYVVVGNAGAPGGPATTNVLWRGLPGDLQVVARSNTQAPGAQAGANFLNFNPLINRSGGVLFYAILSSGHVGVWTVFPGAAPVPRLLTLLNAQAPDMAPGTLLVSISNGGVAFNNRAEGVISASLNFAFNSTPANGVFAGRPGRLRKVVASGDSLEVSPGVFRQVISVQTRLWNSPDSGRQTCINDRGEVAFSCSFVGGDGGAFIARLPHPCPGDATADDLIGFADLNIVLAAMNSILGDPNFDARADFDQDDDVDFADLNVLLSGFNQACN